MLNVAKQKTNKKTKKPEKKRKQDIISSENLDTVSWLLWEGACHKENYYLCYLLANS